MTRLHFHPVRGKDNEIVETILRTEEVASLGDKLGGIHLAVVELVSNIEQYAYTDGDNDYLDIEIERDERHITLCFRDGGVPFNPLELDPPDISLPMSERQLGGLGIFLVIKKMDAIAYEYTHGENVLTITMNTN